MGNSPNPQHVPAKEEIEIFESIVNDEEYVFTEDDEHIEFVDVTEEETEEKSE